MNQSQVPDLIAALEELDKVLKQEGRRFEIIVCGGFVLMQRYGTRKSEDLDVLSPDYVQSLDRAARQVAAEGQLPNLQYDWINWKATQNLGVAAGLPGGWEGRARAEGSLYEGPSGYIVVYGLSRSDLVATKLSAFLSSEREPDLEDLATMGVTVQEVDAAVDDVIELFKHRSPNIRAQLASPAYLNQAKMAIRYIGRNDLAVKKEQIAKGLK